MFIFLALIFLALAGIICIVLVSNHYYEIIIVSGNSMLPTLHDQDFILIDKNVPVYKYKVGDIMVFPDPYNLERLVVKRIKKMKDFQIGDKFEKLLWVEGDNSEVSQDSRVYGWIGTTNIEGRVVKVWQKTRN